MVSDHKPLARIFGPKVRIPPITTAGLQQWALLLSGYTNNIEYRTSRQNANADKLSRFPVDNPSMADPEESFVFKTMTDSLLVNAKQIAECTGKDTVRVKG